VRCGVADAGVSDAGIASREKQTRESQTRESRRENSRRGYGLRAASIQERADRVKELPRRGGEIRVSNKTERREGDFFVGGVI